MFIKMAIRLSVGWRTKSLHEKWMFPPKHPFKTLNLGCLEFQVILKTHHKSYRPLPPKKFNLTQLTTGAMGFSDSIGRVKSWAPSRDVNHKTIRNPTKAGGTTGWMPPPPLEPGEIFLWWLLGGDTSPQLGGMSEPLSHQKAWGCEDFL